MSSQGMICLGLLLVPVLMFVVCFIVMPLARTDRSRGQARCPNCGAVLHETVEAPRALHQNVEPRDIDWTGVKHTNRELICANCGYGLQGESGAYRSPAATTSMGGWLVRRFAPGLARPWERHEDEEAFRERVEGIERKPTPPRPRW